MRTNVTEVYFNGQETAAVFVHWQHDYAQVLRFADIDLPFSYEVDFANVGDTQSKTMIGNANGVEIPDEYLMTGKPINAYIYLHDSIDSGETVKKVSIQVHGRPERTEEIPEPHQQSVIDQAIAALDAAVEQTASDVIDADASAKSASDSADEAKGYSDSAKEYAESAQGYADAASDSASDASDSANEAKGYAEDAEESAQSVLGLTADATVDSNVGTPSVSVSVTTESDHKNMSFAFRNMKGEPGKDGEDGDDGFSPTVSVSDITDGHRVSITDKTGTQDFDVMNGEKGDTGLPGANPISFTATLLASSWSSSALTISDNRLIASGYTYMVSASSSSTRDYQDADIYADDVTTDGSMTFHCVETPTNDLSVNIIRLELGE